ncbi:hypothetical protein [Blastococcus montanus]|uniref:hypothetical protein n=1 Tax=Blastococcus montanus TaxID=3144973 RepID=UPI003209FC22
MVSRLVVLTPHNLRSTLVEIVEQHGDESPGVTVKLPTMNAPRAVSGRHLFTCLPLTDVGYLDLMAWMHPASVPVVPGDRDGRLSASPALGPTEVRRSADPDSGYEVFEHVHRATGVTVARRVLCRGVETRSWEVLDLGPEVHGHLPARIRAVRSESGLFTEFVRTTHPRPIPAAWFDRDIDYFMRAVDAELSERARPT